MSGQTLREFATQRLFAPLGMTATHFRDDIEEVVPLRATGYARADDAWRLADAPFGVVGDGGLLTSVADIGRWAAFLQTGEVLGAALRDALHERVQLADGTTHDYARALQHSRHRGVAVVGHGGSFVGFRAHSLRAAEHGVAVAVLGNRSDLTPETLALAALEVVLEHLGVGLVDEQAPAPLTVRSQPLRRGLWRDPDTGMYARTYDTADGVQLDALGLTLAVREDGDRLRLDGVPLPLELVPDGDELALALDGRRQGLPSYLAVNGSPVSGNLAGDYRSEELEATLSLEPADDGYRLRVGDAEPRLLWDGADDELWHTTLTVKVQRSDGDVSALLLSNGRAVGVRFDRVLR